VTLVAATYDEVAELFEPATLPILSFDPRRLRRYLPSAGAELLLSLLRQGDRFTSGEDTADLVGERWWRIIANHGDVPIKDRFGE
jgi:hypothetical protein